jgi:hypothetical protein
LPLIFIINIVVSAYHHSIRFLEIVRRSGWVPDIRVFLFRILRNPLRVFWFMINLMTHILTCEGIDARRPVILLVHIILEIHIVILLLRRQMMILEGLQPTKSLYRSSLLLLRLLHLPLLLIIYILIGTVNAMSHCRLWMLLLLNRSSKVRALLPSQKIGVALILSKHILIRMTFMLVKFWLLLVRGGDP